MFRKLDALKDVPIGKLAGQMCLVIDIMRQLPVELWFHEQATAYDTNFIPQILTLVTNKILLILDRGFYDFQFFADLIERGAHFITRLKNNAKIEIIDQFTMTDKVRDHLTYLGSEQNGAPILKLRRIEVLVNCCWHCYVTSVLDR